MVIWQRKKNLIIALLSGVIISAVILGSILIVEVINYNTCREELVKIKNEQKGYANIKAYSLNADKKKGDLITEADLVELNLYGENNLIGLASRSDLVNKELKIDVSKGTIMDLSMVHKQDKIADDIRLHIYSYVELHSDILEGSIVDIRITFPDGEDYVIAIFNCVSSIISYTWLINGLSKTDFSSLNFLRSLFSDLVISILSPNVTIFESILYTSLLTFKSS